MSNNLVQNLTQKFNQQQHVTNETKSSVTTNIQTKKIIKTSTSVGTTTKIAASNDEFVRNFKKIESSFSMANKIVTQMSADSGNTKIKSFEKPVLPTRNDFQQNGKTTRVAKTGHNFSIYNNKTITEITKSSKSMEKPAVPKKEFAQKVSTFTKCTGAENIISSQKPVIQETNMKTTKNTLDNTDVQTNKLTSNVKPVVAKKNVLHKMKSDEHSSQPKVIQVPTDARKPVVPKKGFPRKDVTDIGKQIDTVKIKNIEASNHDNIHKQLIPSEIIRQMNARLNENKENSTPEEDKNIKVQDIKTIDAVQNQVENMQRMLDMQMNHEFQLVSEETQEDIIEESKETIQKNRTGTIMNNRYLYGQLRRTVQGTSNKESNTNFTVNTLEETKEVIKEEYTEKIEENLMSNVTVNNIPAYLAMPGPIRSEVKEEISTEESVVQVDVLRSAVVDNEDLTSRAVDNYMPMTLDNYDYVNEEIKVPTIAAYNDDGTYEPVYIANGVGVRGKSEEETYINGDVSRHISELRFDPAKSSRDTFLRLQSNETITETCDIEEEQWLDTYAFQHNLASVSNITPEAISQNSQLIKILQKYDKNTVTWRKIMEYMQLNIINTLTPEKIDAQEAKLHLIRKELIYLDALNVFNNHFISKLVLFISQNEIKILFGNVKEVIECSQKLLKDIEDCWTENVLMPNFAEVLCKNVQTTFNIYISYCENQMNFEKRLENIISDRKRQFKEILDEIQKDPVCRGLHLHAYMLLPIQKIQRFTSLIQNILQFLTPIDEEYHQFHNLLDHVNHLLKKCSKAVKDKEIWAKTLEFMNQLEFPKDVSADELGVNEKRQIIRSGEVEMLEITNSLFGRKITRKPVHLFLFNDLLVIARKNSKDKYSVVQFSLRIYVEIETDSLAVMQYYEFVDSSDCFLLKIDERIPKEILIICKTASDKIRWHHALDPEDPHTRNQYELDGYFQVIGEYNYKPCQSDEISFHATDIIHVYRNIENSWYFGKNIKTGDVGWFPAKYVYCRDQK